MRVAPLGGVDGLRSHWYPRPSWAGGRRIVTWHLTFGDAPALAAVAGRAARALAGIGYLEPVPTPWLHLTLVGVGYADDLTAPEVARVQQAVAAALLGGIGDELVLDELSVGAEGVLLGGSGLGWVERLAATVAAATDAALPGGPWAGDRAPVWPHVSLAYANGPGALAPVVEALEPLAATEEVRARAELALLELRLEERAYRWDVIGSV